MTIEALAWKSPKKICFASCSIKTALRAGKKKNHWLSFFPYVFRMLEFSLQYGRVGYICWVMIYGICKMRKRKLFKQMQCGPEKQSAMPEIHRSDGLYQRENESLWIRQRKRAGESSSHSAAQCYFKPWFCPTSDEGQSGKIRCLAENCSKTHPNISCKDNDKHCRQI